MVIWYTVTDKHMVSGWITFFVIFHQPEMPRAPCSSAGFRPGKPNQVRLRPLIPDK